VLAVLAIAQSWNMTGAPQRIDDEGTYTAQAWAIFHLGELTHYTYWYDHPPLGWIQIAGYTQVTAAWARYPFAVDAGREAMVFFALASAALVFVLARRLTMARPSAAVASLIFGLSPLAIQYHRTVYLDNVATPWLLAAFVLALSRRQQLAGFAAAAACLGIAVLSKETYLLAAPFLAWTAIRRSDPLTRRYTLSVAGAVLGVIGGSYVLLAAVKGELFPSAGHVSLLQAIAYQLSSRQSSGSILDPSSLAFKAASQWWRLDPTFIVLGTAAAVLALFMRRIRPIAVMLIVLLALMLRPNGYLPVPYVIMLIPFGALVIAFTAERAVVGVRGLFTRRPTMHRVFGYGWLAICAAALVAAVPLWTIQLRGFLITDQDAPMASAEQWTDHNVPKSSRLLVDDAMWVDLVRDGFARNNVIWFYKLDTDSAVEKQSPKGWKDSDYIITTNSMRTDGTATTDVKKAIANSTTVATFGAGTTEVDIRQIEPQGLTTAKKEIAATAAARRTIGTQIASNPSLEASAATLSQFRAGQVDPRAVVVLGQLLAGEHVRVQQFTPIGGEAGQMFRQMRIEGSSSADTARLEKTLRAVKGTLAPQSVQRAGRTLTVTFSDVNPTTNPIGGTP
jgi:hypothetical protein